MFRAHSTNRTGVQVCKRSTGLKKEHRPQAWGRGSGQAHLLSGEGFSRMEVKGFQPEGWPGEASRFVVITFCSSHLHIMLKFFV